MPYIQLKDKQFPLKVGQARVGGDAGADIPVPGAEATIEAIIDLSADNRVSIRRASTAATVRVNGVALGVEPSPLIHGDKIEVGGSELLFGDDRKGGSTQYISGINLPELMKARASGQPAKPTTGTGGRLVSLVDGREYSISPTGLTIGRDAGCDVVVPSSDVSRRHAEITPAPNGYVVSDLSTNGVFVNGERIQQSQVLGRADVLRVGNEEFRFYADVVTAAPAPPPVSVPPKAMPMAPAPAPAPAMAGSAAAPAAPKPAAPPPAPAPPRPAATTPPAHPPAPPKAAAPPPAPPRPAAPPPAPPRAAAPPAPKAPPAPAPAPAAPPPRESGGARPVLATLEIMNVGPLKGKKFELRGPLSHVGRGEHNDIILNDESVSDSHAKLQKREAGWFVVDMESTNGTYVGGRRLTGEQQLVGAPDVRFGGIKMIFRPAADALEEGKGTRAITGVTIEQAKARAAASKEVRTSAAAGGAEPVTAPSPSVAPHEPSSAPTPQPAGGIPGWIWVVLLAAVVIAAVLILKGR